MHFRIHRESHRRPDAADRSLPIFDVAWRLPCGCRDSFDFAELRDGTPSCCMMAQSVPIDKAFEHFAAVRKAGNASTGDVGIASPVGAIPLRSPLYWYRGQDQRATTVSPSAMMSSTITVSRRSGKALR